jgi:hypothetical protein
MMRLEIRSALIVLLGAALAVSAGCDGDNKDDTAGDDGKFRIPDSLLSPIEGYKLKVDDYHPVNGGVMANDDIELHYPPKEIARFIAVKSFGEIHKGYRKVVKQIGRPVDGRVVIIGAADFDEYRVMTRKEWWYYAWIKGDTIYSEPLDILLKRWDPITGMTLVEIGLTQRMAQLALDGLSSGRIPIWMKEAAASYVAGERPVLHQQVFQFADMLEGWAPSVEELEDHILAGNDMQMSRLSYFFVYRMLENLLEKYEFRNVTGFARRLGDGASLDEASRGEFGMSYEEMIAAIRPVDILDGAGPLETPDLDEGTHSDHDH